MEKVHNNKQHSTIQTKNIPFQIPTIYEDKYTKITTLYILIDKYYFPLATSKTIFYNQIKRIQLKSSQNVHTIWGISRSQLNHWFHLDQQRKNKKYFLSIQLKNRNVKIGLSPEKPLQAFYKIRELFSHSQNIGQDIQMESNMSTCEKQESIQKQKQAKNKKSVDKQEQQCVNEQTVEDINYMQTEKEQ